jgi:hypothetical protein
MQNRPPLFVIPTYRLRDVGETIQDHEKAWLFAMVPA